MASAALDITFPGNLAKVPNAAMLRLVPSATLLDDDVYLVASLKNLFFYDTSSVSIDDGVTVIRPADLTPLQAGRWLAGGPVPDGTPTPTPTPTIDASKLSDRTNFKTSMLPGETAQQTFDRLMVAGIRRLYVPTGRYTIGCEPWTNGDIQDPNSPNYLPGYTINDLIEGPGNVLAGLDILGDGMDKTVFVQGDSNYGFMGSSLGGAPIKGVKFEGVCFEGNNANYVNCSQTFHNFAAFGIDGLTIHRCRFFRSPGDGIYLARGPKQLSPNHNYNVRITECEFDGVNNINRNPVSHEDCKGLTVANCFFKNFTENGQPGGYDVEPVVRTGVLGTDIWDCGAVVLAFNRFEKCNGVAFCFQMDPRLSIKPAGMILVHGNIVEDNFSFIDVVGPPDDQDNITRTFSAIVTNNIVRRCVSVLGRIGGGLGLEIEGNIFEDSDFIRLGYGWGNRFLRIRRNIFRRCGKTNGFVFIAPLDCRHVRLDDNDFEDCGRTDRVSTNAILLTQDGPDEFASQPGVVRPRIMGISLVGNRTYNTSSDGGAGRLTHHAIQNATGGYGPGAEKSNNRIYGTPIPNADTFNPPVPNTAFTYTWTVTQSFQVGTTRIDDLTVPGAFKNQQFSVMFVRGANSNYGVGESYILSAFGRDSGVVRLGIQALLAGGQTFLVNAGDKFVLTERTA